MSDDEESNYFEIDDPIIEAFPVMLEAAHQHCRLTTENNQNCFEYHRLWSYRRRLFPHSAALSHGGHFVKWFRNVAREGLSQRVLVSGTADYGLLAQVLHGYRAEGVEPHIKVLDICETPLVINRWYAERQNAIIRTLRSDIVNYSCTDAYGLITTDNFLSRLPPAKRSTLLATWRDLLCTGGRIVSTESILNESVADGAERPDIPLGDRLGGILHRAQTSDLDALGITRETLARYIRDDLSKRGFYELESLEEMQQLFEDNGFRIEEMSRAASRKRRAGARRSKRHSRYNIVATRTS